MQQNNSWKSYRFSASQQLFRILWNPKFQRRTHKCLPTAPILSHIDFVLVLISRLVKIHLAIVLTSTAGSSKWTLSLRFLQINLYTPQLSPIHAICLNHLIRLGFITRTVLGEENRSLSSSLCSFPHSPVTSCLLGRNILLNILFLNTLSLRTSLNVSDKVSHPHKRTVRIIFMYILSFVFLCSKLVVCGLLHTNFVTADDKQNIRLLLNREE